MDRFVFYAFNSIEKQVLSGSAGKVNRFFKLKDSISLITLGSSRALHHVISSELNPSSFNMGVDGTRIAYASAMISTLKKKNQLILVHVDHNRIFDQNYKGKDAEGLLYKKFEIPELAAFFNKYYRQEVYTAMVSKCYAYNGMLLGVVKNYLSPTEISTNLNGYEPIYPTDTQQQIFAEMLVNTPEQWNVNISKPLQISKTFNDFIDAIIKKANSTNSTVVFITSPSLNKVDNEVKNEAALYFTSKAVMYWDDIDLFEEFNASLWKDYTHLSHAGAKEYTAHLQTRMANIPLN